MMKQKVKEAKDVLIEAMRRSDSSLYSEIYGEHGQILMEGGLIIQGRKNIMSQIQSFMELLGPLDFSLKTIDIWAQEEFVYESGHFSYKYLGKGDAPFYSGTYVYIWKICDDGEVYLHRNISIDE